jgi:biopolymer transport protein ExbD
MAGIDAGSLGSPSGRRALNRELTLVPFIDFLLCIVAFLLVTAVWSQMARLEASARAPGGASGEAPSMETELHVDMRSDDRFVLTWRTGNTVVDQTSLPRRAVPSGAVTYPELANLVTSEWKRRGAHRAPMDYRRDRAVLHASNSAPFEQIVAAMDALHAVTRPAESGSTPAFDVVFAVD